ncbi:potassium voltage-gated channel protein Shaw-like [Lineus longissimus]|uniref:potassium voltage-gated channel protein Shaw-like n=1 Tax=Lineus longissimus TaxID=88925 RepID=UPI00315DF43B
MGDDDEGVVYIPRNLSLNDRDIMVMNVGGTRFEVNRKSLAKYPGTKLFEIAGDARSNDCKEVFLDRNPAVFDTILNYYRTGELHIPNYLCGPFVRGELKYYNIADHFIEPCCWVGYSAHIDTEAALAKFDGTKDETEKVHPDTLSGWKQLKNKTWVFMEDPNSSLAAKVFASWSFFLVILSIIIFCLETHPFFIGPVALNNTFIREVYILNEYPPMRGLVVVDNICNGWFLIEFMVKFAVSPSKGKFLVTAFSVIEIFSLVPYYIGMGLALSFQNHIENLGVALEVLFFFKMIRILRIFTLMRHIRALKILVYTLIASTKELLLLVLILLIGVIVFACLIYLAERREVNTFFPHIPISLWWAMVTITTLGYGDLRPTTWQGYIVGSMCAATGVLIIALTVPIVVNNFSVYYTFAQRTSRLKERRMEKEKQERRMSIMMKALKHMHTTDGNTPSIRNGGSANIFARLRKKKREVADAHINLGNGTIRAESALSTTTMSSHGDSNRHTNIPIDDKPRVQNGVVNRSFSMQSDINNLNVSVGSDKKPILQNKISDPHLLNVGQTQEGSTLRLQPSPTPSEKNFDVSISDKSSVSYHLQKPAISVSLSQPEVTNSKESLNDSRQIANSEHHRLLPAVETPSKDECEESKT